jgi:biopolymer transport protein ExbB
MKTLLFSAIVVLGLALPTLAGTPDVPAGATPAAVGTVPTDSAGASLTATDDLGGRLSRSAEEELATSTEELNALQKRILGEKLPLAKELTALEDRVSQLRRDQVNLAREVEKGDGVMLALRGEVKLRKDELDYIDKLLDQYVRTFESSLNVCELQYCREPIEAAKLAPTNNDLSMSEKFARQLAFVEISKKRAFDLIGGIRFPGVGVDMLGNVVKGQFALYGPVALFSDKTSGTAGLAVPQSGSDKPLIRPLEGPMQPGLAALVDSGEGTLPLDPSRGGALVALVQKTNLFHIFKKGGPIMYPLLLASILALGTVLERFIFLAFEKMRRNTGAMEAFFVAVGKGDFNRALEIGRKTKFYVLRPLCYALEHKDVSVSNALIYAQAKELKRFERGLPVLDTVITLAPLLGLLGTVTGMMGSFSLIGGDLGAPGEITGGIAEALIATAFGLGIAIISLIPFNALNARVEQARHELESASTQLELLLQPAMASAAVTAGQASSVGKGSAAVSA